MTLSTFINKYSQTFIVASVVFIDATRNVGLFDTLKDNDPLDLGG